MGFLHSALQVSSGVASSAVSAARLGSSQAMLRPKPPSLRRARNGRLGDLFAPSQAIAERLHIESSGDEVIAVTVTCLGTPARTSMSMSVVQAMATHPSS